MSESTKLISVGFILWSNASQHLGSWIALIHELLMVGFGYAQHGVRSERGERRKLGKIRSAKERQNVREVEKETKRKKCGRSGIRETQDLEEDLAKCG